MLHRYIGATYAYNIQMLTSTHADSTPKHIDMTSVNINDGDAARYSLCLPLEILHISKVQKDIRNVYMPQADPFFETHTTFRVLQKLNKFH